MNTTELKAHTLTDGDRQGIEECEVFVMFYSPHWGKEKRQWEQLSYALILQKPVIVIRHKDRPVLPKMLQEAGVPVTVIEWDGTESDITHVTNKLTAMFTGKRN